MNTLKEIAPPAVSTQPEASVITPAPLLVYWAFGDIYSGQFFLCKSRRKRFKQLVLLFKLGCAPSEKELCSPESIPVVGGVYNDTDKNRIECHTFEWV